MAGLNPEAVASEMRSRVGLGESVCDTRSSRGTWTVFENETTVEIVRWAVLIGATGIASIYDLRERRIPNMVTFPMVLTGLLVAILLGGWGWSGFLDSLAAMFIVGFPCLIVYARGGGGAGDVKLMMGVGAWCGVDLGVYVLIAVSLTGVIWAMLLAASRGQFKALMYGMSYQVWLLLKLRRPVPAGAGTSAGEKPSDVQAQPSSISGSELAYGPVIMVGMILGGVAWFLL